MVCALLAGICHADVKYKGVNFSGGENNCNSQDQKYGFKYIYPNAKFMDGFLDIGMNIFRLPFCWERLQPTAFGELDKAELARLDQTVSYLTTRNAYVIIDPHNYAAYWGKRIGKGTTKEMLADFWGKLAGHYANNNRVMFGLMNEPNGISGETWLEAANSSIAAIRAAPADNLILVPGVVWSGAHSWYGTYYGTPNAVTMLQIKDPKNNYAFEVHQYLDKDSSGTAANCMNENIGVTRIAAFTSWLRQNGKKGLLGEFAGGRDAVCAKALYNMLDNLRNNSDVWLGWTWWSAGPWLGNYMFNLNSTIDPSKPNQIDVVKQFLGCSDSAACAPKAPTVHSIVPARQ
jgi:endoglucanase